jgi:SAM-dependent methyltransferase
VWRALLKGAALAGLGHAPGGAEFYRTLTRERMGTQGSHVDKLRRVWPGYARVWRERCGLELEGLRVWVHDGGWTPYPSLMLYLMTGDAGVVTNDEGRVLDRYVARAVNGALATEVPEALSARARRERVEALRWCPSARDALAAVGARVHDHVAPDAVPLPDGAADLCHSGGALEHYPPAPLAAFLRECHRVLRPGGIASHVLDHRDHLHHADARWPFLAHLALREGPYRVLCGHALGYHNRLTPTEVQALFDAAGFERIAVRRMTLPAKRYVPDDEVLAGRPGLPRALLAPRFRAISDEDLRSAAVHYVYRKRA